MIASQNLKAETFKLKVTKLMAIIGWDDCY